MRKQAPGIRARGEDFAAVGGRDIAGATALATRAADSDVDIEFVTQAHSLGRTAIAATTAHGLRHDTLGVIARGTDDAQVLKAHLRGAGRARITTAAAAAAYGVAESTKHSVVGRAARTATAADALRDQTAGVFALRRHDETGLSRVAS